MKAQLIKKLVSRLAKVLLVAIALLALFILEENIRGHVMLSRCKAELRAKGEKLTWEELNLPKPTTDNRVSKIVLAGDELSELRKRCPFNVDEPVFRLNFIQPGCCLVRQLQTDSGIKLLTENSSISSRGRPVRSAAEPPTSRPPVQMCSWEQFDEQLGLAREPLRQIRVALQNPVPAVAIDSTQGLRALKPQSDAARTATTWFSATVLSDLHQHDFGKALEDLLTITTLVRFLRNDQFIMDFIGPATGEKGLDVTWEALQANGWTDEQLSKLQIAWEGASMVSGLIGEVEVERVSLLDEWERLLRQPMHQLLHLSDVHISSWADVSMQMQAVMWYFAWEQQDEARGQRIWQKNIDDVRMAIRAPSWTVARARFEQTNQEEWGHLRFYDNWRYQVSIPDFVTGSTPVPAFDRDTQRMLEYETRREMTVVAIALKRFELRHGRLPTELALLVPELLSEVPRDRMNGGQLHYRLNMDGTWALYSVGDDGLDNGGDPMPVRPQKMLWRIWDGRDAVWPQPVL